MKTQHEKIMNFLRSGATLSATQARGMFDIENVSARVAELRESGNLIFTKVNRSTGVASYQLATPYELNNWQLRRFAKLAYRAAGCTAFV